MSWKCTSYLQQSAACLAQVWNCPRVHSNRWSLCRNASAGTPPKRVLYSALGVVIRTAPGLAAPNTTSSKASSRGESICSITSNATATSGIVGNSRYCLDQKVDRCHLEEPFRRQGGTSEAGAGLDNQREEVIRVDRARTAVVADVARTEDAYRQSSRNSRPDKPLRNPFGLIVASLRPVDEAVYIAVFKVGVVVSSGENAVG